VRTAIISTYPPRACGIGSFAADLKRTLKGVTGVDRVDVVAIVNGRSRPQQRGLLSVIHQDVRRDYRRVARLLGRLEVDVVLLQHEYWIFGGTDGDYVLAFTEELAQPLVVTLHTVLSEPTPHQLKVLKTLCAHAQLVIVMTDTAAFLLVQCGACSKEKVRVVPHGAPSTLIARADEYVLGLRRREFRQAGSQEGTVPFLLSTFGLIAPAKGLETVIEALPSMLKRHPNIVYVIAGRTHPEVAHQEGEQYRLMLERRVFELDLAGHVEFDDRFLTTDELADLLAATDVFVTPYRSREQVVSGALTFAIAAGCCVVSTPYWYARDMLETGAGSLVPFDDPEALAEGVCAYAAAPEMIAEARRHARKIGSSLAWPAVAAATARVLQEAQSLSSTGMPP